MFFLILELKPVSPGSALADLGLPSGALQIMTPLLDPTALWKCSDSDSVPLSSLLPG